VRVTDKDPFGSKLRFVRIYPQAELSQMHAALVKLNPQR
jgi:hypothetical protein